MGKKRGVCPAWRALGFRLSGCTQSVIAARAYAARGGCAALKRHLRQIDPQHSRPLSDPPPLAGLASIFVPTLSVSLSFAPDVTIGRRRRLAVARFVSRASLRASAACSLAALPSRRSLRAATPDHGSVLRYPSKPLTIWAPPGCCWENGDCDEGSSASIAMRAIRLGRGEGPRGYPRPGCVSPLSASLDSVTRRRSRSLLRWGSL
jgi:hypothetical protein